jgi:hypothetical protein
MLLVLVDARLVMVAATMHGRWTDQHRTPFAAPG